MIDRGTGNENADAKKTADLQEVAEKAYIAFTNGCFQECVQALNLISEQRQYDVTIIHNCSVAKYYQSDFTNFKEFRTSLTTVCNLAGIDFDNLDSMDDAQNCVMCYNEAILCFHAKQYNTAIKILNKLFTLIELMDEELAKRVSQLSIEIYLVTHRPEKALALVDYIENLFYPSEMAASSVEDSSENAEFEPLEDTYLNIANDSFRLKLLEYRLRCHLSLHMFTKCNKELNILTSNTEKVVMKVDYETKERFEARCLNMKCASKLLTAYFEYLKGSFKSCIELIGSIPLPNNFEETGDSIPLIVYNNMGCAHFYLKKPNLATFYFQKAIDEHNNSLKRFAAIGPENMYSGRPLFTLGSNRMLQLMYNLSVALLFSGKPMEAFDCLTEETVQVYHMNPRVWLRLAECCIMVHKPSNDRDFDYARKRKDVLKNVVGKGKHRKLILNLRLFDNNKYSYDAQSFAIPVASLEFATLCLRNALLLLSNEKVEFAPSNPMIGRKPQLLRMATLIASAYVALCIGDPLIALSHTRNLFNMQNCPGIYKFLGHLYTAEALIMLNKIPEAMEHLKPDFCNYITDKSENDVMKRIRTYKPDSALAARSVLLYNLAVSFILKSNIKRASDILKQIWLIKTAPRYEIPVQVISLALYIEIASGRLDVARNIIRQNCAQYKISSLL